MNRRDFLKTITAATTGLAIASGPGKTDTTSGRGDRECQHDRLDDGEPCEHCDYVAPLPPPTSVGADPVTREQIDLSWDGSIRDESAYHYQIRVHPKE